MLKRKPTIEPSTLATCRKFIPSHQLRFIRELIKGEEGEFFAEALTKLESEWNAMPELGAVDGDSAIVRIHLFAPSADWWLVERSMDDVNEAFGIADMGYREMGYIPLDEIIQLRGVEVDLHWHPKTVAEIMADNS